MERTTTDRSLQALLNREFAVRARGVYANHAAISPWPSSVAEAVARFAAENVTADPGLYRDWIERERRLRRQLADLINAPSPADIALLKNTTEGISAVAWGLDWRRGDNVVLPAAEFASNRLPWLAQQPLGVEVREVDIRAAEDAEGALIDALDDRTRLLSVSAVQWNDGFRLDLPRLGAACRQRGVLFFVDAIQQLGALRLDVRAGEIDFLAADAHKWLLGPEGIAVFFSTAEARPKLRLLQQGWHMFDDAWDFHRDDWTPTRSARRFEAGSPNSLGQAALAAALDLQHAVGPDVIEARVLANTDWLMDRLAALPDVQLVSRTDRLRRSGIVTFRPRRAAAAAVHRALQALDIACALREQAIRLSPHFYQGPADLERVLDAVEQSMTSVETGR